MGYPIIFPTCTYLQCYILINKKIYIHPHNLMRKKIHTTQKIIRILNHCWSIVTITVTARFMNILNHLPNYPFNEIYMWRCQRLLFSYTRCLGASVNQAHGALTKKVHKVGQVGGANYRCFITHGITKRVMDGVATAPWWKNKPEDLKRERERLSCWGSELFEGWLGKGEPLMATYIWLWEVTQFP